MIFLFRKTRIIDFPNLEFFKEIPMELAEKFKLKVYKLFYDSHLFSNPKALINMIGMFGLFENDDKVQKRINDIINIFFFFNFIIVMLVIHFIESFLISLIKYIQDCIKND